MAEKALLMDRQSRQCSICGSELDKLCQIDHITPLCEAVDASANDLSNLRLLCPTCHLSVTQQPRRPQNALLSHHNPHTWDFVKSPLPAQMVQKFNRILETRPIISVDIRACRRSALTESEREYPVYCALDEIVEVKTSCANLSDCNWIDAGPIKSRAMQLRGLPYQGPRWMSKLATQWCLKRGIITWEDIKLGYQVSGHLPKHFFRPHLEYIKEAFCGEGLYKLSLIHI